MSVELGDDDKNIVYVNMSKSGVETENSAATAQTCTVTIDFNDSAILEKENAYLVAVSRFSVPLSQVPIINATGFSVYRYPTVTNAITFDQIHHQEEVHGHTYETTNYIHGTQVNYHKEVLRVDISPCFTIYEFLEKLEKGLHRAANNTDNLYNPAPLVSTRIKITSTPDRRFVVWINNDGSLDDDHWYVRFDKSLFALLQFQETIPSTTANHLPGRRFFQHDITEKYRHQEMVNGSPGVSTEYSIHISHSSASDMSCHRSIVFSTDLSVKSERNSSNEGSYKRYLVDYSVTSDTQFSYTIRKPITDDPYDLDVSKHYLGNESTVTEPLPSARVYASVNPSAGRWQILTSPSSLYKFECRAMLKIFDYDSMRFKLVPITLAAGATFNVKLIFVSRRHYELNADKYHH